jgi:hypothetical protein
VRGASGLLNQTILPVPDSPAKTESQVAATCAMSVPRHKHGFARSIEAIRHTHNDAAGY